jgi:hypothetical protein
VHEYPGISKNIEDKLSVNNTTPQVLIIEAGKCIFSASFGGVDYRNIRALSNLRRLIPK